MLTWTSSRLSSNFRPTNPNRITPNRTINHRNCFPTSPYSFYPRFPRNCTVSNFAFNHALSSPIVPLPFSITRTLVLKFFKHTNTPCTYVETNPKLLDNYISITSTNARIVSISITIILLSCSSFSVPVSGSNRVAKFPRRSGSWVIRYSRKE